MAGQFNGQAITSLLPISDATGEITSTLGFLPMYGIGLAVGSQLWGLTCENASITPCAQNQVTLFGIAVRNPNPFYSYTLNGFSEQVTLTITPTPIPEPCTMLLLLSAGLIGLLAMTCMVRVTRLCHFK
jgi:hypothetical protein